MTAARHIFGRRPALRDVPDRQRTPVAFPVRAHLGRRGSPRPGCPSVANALVTDVKDPLRQGRVKLRFPWLDDTYVSDWTRTVQFGGVKRRRLIVPLDVDDEVLVAFDRGALDHPFVIGGLYNGKDKPGAVDVPAVRRAPAAGRVRHTLADRRRQPAGPARPADRRQAGRAAEHRRRPADRQPGPDPDRDHRRQQGHRHHQGHPVGVRRGGHRPLAEGGRQAAPSGAAGCSTSSGTASSTSSR